MIIRHDFNTEWLGRPAGIVTDPAVFELPDRDRARLLAPFHWVEFHALADAAPSPRRIAAAGFFQADTQVRYRIDLRNAGIAPRAAALTARFADHEAFSVDPDEMAVFRWERFRFLPGMDDATLNRRYALWAARLLREDPGSAMRIYEADALQGWFFGRRTEAGLELTLAALHREARVFGLLLYQRAMAAYSERGATTGSASFSIANTAAHNIYAKLGARFQTPELVWMWIARDFQAGAPHDDQSERRPAG